MIEQILPSCVTVAEAFNDDLPAPLFPEEEQSVARAVDQRRREFATGRRCAREALSRLGHAPIALPKGAAGAPQWPAGVVGSITHCRGYRAAVAATSTQLRSIGVDAEPNERLPNGVLELIADDRERAMLAELSVGLPAVHWDRLLFCAKEAVYKAWSPLTHRRPSFEDVTMSLHMTDHRIEAIPLVPAPVAVFFGHWLAYQGLLFAAVIVERATG